MNYNYEELKKDICSEEGQKGFLKTRDKVNKLLTIAGAFRTQESFVIDGACDTFTLHARIDRLVELGEIREVTSGTVMSQNRVFVKS